MSAKLINVTLDLETLGTDEDAAIIQIGMCVPEFDRIHLPKLATHEMEVTIAYEECLAATAFSKSTSTMDWWETQPINTRKLVFSGQESYVTAFDQVEDWLKAITSGGAEVAIWGNGSDFDNRLLAYSMSAVGYKPAWKYWNNRCLRTLKALFPVDLTMQEAGEIKHTALGDARYEARLINAVRNTYVYAGDTL